MGDKICSIDGCDKHTHARGLCHSHYVIELRADGERPTCQIMEGNNRCGKPIKGRGMCEKHYMRQRRNGDPLVVGKPRAYVDTSHQRFWAKVKKTDTCWLWTGGKIDGYGIFSHRSGEWMLSHRFAWERVCGPIPNGLLLDHMCGSRACVNVDHLRLVNHKQNKEHLTRLYSNNTSGAQGVWWDRGAQKWRAAVQHNGKVYRLGRFTDLEDAAAAARAKRNELFTHNDLDRK